MRLYRPYFGANNNVPVEVATAVATDATGQFRFAGAPVGEFKLMADGGTATKPGPWPTLEFDLLTVAGKDNTVGYPIYLPSLGKAGKLCVDESSGGKVTLAEVPGFELTVAPGSVTFPGGARSGCVSVSAVHMDKVPMVPGFGQQPRFVVTIQPVGATFNPPAALTLPNVDSLAPHHVTEMYSFDHDLNAFVAIGTATVSDDGSVVKSDPGVGVLKAGWHAAGDPGISTTVGECPECQKCITTGCVPDGIARSLRIVTPSNNAAPDDALWFSNFSFLSTTAISAAAIATPSADSGRILWTTAALNSASGTVQKQTPASRTGPSYGFTPNPPSPLTYRAGTTCASPGNGSCNRHTPLSYRISVAGKCKLTDGRTVSQDQRDIIRQEYLSHGISDMMPLRSDLINLSGTAHFAAADLSKCAYNLIYGNPGSLAEAVRTNFNQLLNGDIQVVPPGTRNLSPTTVIVSSSNKTISYFETPLLMTTRCNQAKNLSTCDDQVINGTIVAGADGIAETVVLRGDFSFNVSSGWRNPQRNEAVGGVLKSDHQLGNAIDLVIAPVGSLTTSKLYSILYTAASQIPSTFVQCETGPAKRIDCTLGPITHLHVSKR